MEKTISLHFKYTAEEYVAATRLYLRRSADFFIRLSVCVLYSIASAALFIWLDISLSTELWLLLALVVCIPFIIAFLHLLVIPRRRFRGDPKFQDEYQLHFSDDGIQFKTAQIDALLQWSLYDKVIEDERFYLLVYGKHMISVIPKRAFIDEYQEAAFRRMIGRNLPAYSNSKRMQGRPVNDAATRPYVPPAEPPDWR
ncbi:MAG TPA: YcxB family protein [Pyrinomonadaceae bacterium]|nr:YcxB family protein [Pyrinomonadaceae bacterium]